MLFQCSHFNLDSHGLVHAIINYVNLWQEQGKNNHLYDGEDVGKMKEPFLENY